MKIELGVVTRSGGEWKGSVTVPDLADPAKAIETIMNGLDKMIKDGGLLILEVEEGNCLAINAGEIEAVGVTIEDEQEA